MHSVVASILSSLLSFQQRGPIPERYVVAYSGGCDSHALLFALNELRHLRPKQLSCSDIVAIHVNHGLQAESDVWQQHCAAVCNELSIDIISIRLELTIPKGESLEAYAREARYQAIRERLQEGDMLLLAQHQDDQAETVLLQALRGSGVKGLAAMPEIIETGATWQARPMLLLCQDQIEEYAKSLSSSWIDDPSNGDLRFDRNYLRHQVIPEIKKRWPSMSETLSRVASHQADADQLLTELALSDWQSCRPNDRYQLDTVKMAQLSELRQKNLLRFWIGEQCGFPVPDAASCQRILDQVIMAGPNADPELRWADVVLRRYRGVLYIEKYYVEDNQWQQSWDFSTPLILPGGDTLQAQSVEGQGLSLPAEQSRVSVRFRQGGEKCQLPGRRHRHELKKLLQEWGVPPWQRDRIPLICIDDQVAQVVGYSLCEPFIARAGQIGHEICIKE
ncbi:tRNA(Ile)-lysidine synthetase [hydrothermal vent metagenome]|uniref:tRNA(Ile)-lysidine synthetase n=1 Tax=hydrothermal vent metagenome TaxID=652676 RepID=A0A3B0ZZ35_9ZZZZ